MEDDKMPDVSIEIYSTPTWPDYKLAKEFLSQHNIHYTEHDVSKDEEKVEALTNLTGKMIVQITLFTKWWFVFFCEASKILVGNVTCVMFMRRVKIFFFLQGFEDTKFTQLFSIDMYGDRDLIALGLQDVAISRW
jgi:glutaredoxin